MTTTNIAEVLNLAAKPVPYDNDEKTWLEFRAKLENYLTMVDEVCGASAGRRVSSNGETSIKSTKLETGAKSAEQKWVRGVETVGGGEGGENRGSEIRDAASRATARDE